MGFSWRLELADRYHYHPGNDPEWSALPIDHLDLTCGRCGWGTSMRTKDEEGT